MIEQGSDEWIAMRLGKATASRISDVVAKTNSGYSASRTNYMAELVAERLTGTRGQTFTNEAMQWGTEKEPDALAAYEFLTNAEIERAAFVPHPKIGMSGASPDGLVGADGMVEVKCPNTATHIDTLLGQNVPGKYITQIMWQLACTGRQWCDFGSFDPRMPDSMRLFIRRVPRDDVMIADLEKEVVAFLAEVAKKVSDLKRIYEPTNILQAG